MGEVCAFLASQKLKFHSNQRWISTASADFIFPSAPRPGFRRDERLRQGYRPSAGLRPLIVSRVKCGADLVEATQCFRVREIRYAFKAPL